MTDYTSRSEIFKQLADLYEKMAAAYAELALRLDFSCQGCEDNCCDSYFQHYTYLEWAYLWEGLTALPEEQRQRYLHRARENAQACATAFARGERPTVMCPLNDDGRCGLYDHRLLICRLHGVPARLTNPKGASREFLGCHRCQELLAGRQDPPFLDRTPFFRTMVELEQAYQGPGPRRTKIAMTLAEMLLQGPPI